jgi:hypothetical protein
MTGRGLVAVPRRSRSEPAAAQQPRHRSFRRSKGYLLLPVVLVIAVVAAVAFLMNRESAVDIRAAGSAAEGDAARYVAEAGLRHVLWKSNTDACSGYSLPATPFGSHSYQATLSPDNGSPVYVTVTGTLASGASRTLRRDGVRVLDTPSVLTVQPDADAGEDAFIDEFKPTWSYGARTNLIVEGYAGSGSRSLIRFDLSGIPPNAQIVEATLDLYQLSNAANGGTFNVHRLTREWEEGDGTGSGGTGVTWLEYKPGNSWTTPGGDYDPAILAATAIPAGGSGIGWHSWDITELVDGWRSGAYPNRGLLLKTQDVNSSGYFASSDESGSGRQPKLTITYACECGVACVVPPPSCDADFTPNALVGQFSTAGQGYRYNRGITFFPEGQSINGTPAPAAGGWIAVGESGLLVLLDMAGNILDDGFDTGLDHLKGITFVPSGAEAGHLAVLRDKDLYFVDPTVLPASASYTTHALPFAERARGTSYIDGGTYDGYLAIVDATTRVISIVDQSANLVTTLFTDSILNKPEGIAHLRNTDKFLVVEHDLDTALVLQTDLTISQNYDLTQYGYGNASGAAIHPTSCNHVISDHQNDRYVFLNVLSSPLNLRVAGSSDDAEELMTTNDVDLVGADLQLVEDLGLTQMVGLRFANVAVPIGATITSAWIQFQAAAANSGPSNLTLQGEAADDAAPFAAVSANISARPLTAASVAWTPGNWSTVGEAGLNQRTADISSVIQEIVDRPGWAPGNALAVVVSGSNTRTAESFDGDPAAAPLLHIEF